MHLNGQMLSAPFAVNQTASQRTVRRNLRESTCFLYNAFLADARRVGVFASAGGCVSCVTVPRRSNNGSNQTYRHFSMLCSRKHPSAHLGLSQTSRHTWK